MARVTDPNLLQQLNASPDYSDPAVRDATVANIFNGGEQPSAAPKKAKKVTDPRLLEKLNNPNADTNFGENVMTGVHEGLTNRGVGVIQTAYDVMKTLGMVDENPEFEATIQKAHAKVEQGAKGSKIGGFVGEVVGDPINWIGGGAAAAERQIAKQVGLKAMKEAAVKGAGEAGIKTAARKAITKQLAKDGAKVGAKIGAAGQATGVQKDDKLSTRGINTAIGAAAGAAGGAAIPLAAGATGATIRGAGRAASDIAAAGRSGTGRGADELNATVAAMKKEGGDLANKMRAANVSISPQDAQSIVTKVRQGLSNAGLDNQLHPETVAALRELEERAQGKFANDVNGNPGLDIISLDNIRKKLGMARGEDAGTAGQFRAAMEGALEDPNMFAGAPPAALDIRDQFLNQWKKTSRFEDLTELANKANNDPNRIRTVVNKFTDEDSNRGKFTPDEWEAIMRSGSRTVGDKLLGLAGAMGVDMGSISRNPRAMFPWLMATAKSGAQAGGGYMLGGPVPVVVGTVANSVKNRVANGRLEKAMRLVEERDVVPPARPAPPQRLLPAPTPPQTPLWGVQGGGVMTPSPAQQAAADATRQNYTNMGLTGDVLKAQRNTQVSAAEAEKAIQDAAAAQQRTNELAASAQPPSIGDMFADSQMRSADLSAATGDPAQLGSVGQALAEAIRRQNRPVQINTSNIQ